MRTMSPAAHRMADRFTARMFRGLWVPAMLSSLGWALSDMADAVVVGQRLGAVGLAAIGLILPVYMINCMFAHGLGLGGSVRYSRLLSQGKTQEAADSFHGVLALALLFSVTTAVLGSVFIDPLLALLGTRSTDGALYAATRDYLQILVAATPLFYLSNVFNYYLRNDGSQRRAGCKSQLDKQHRYADGGDGNAQGAGEDGGGEKVEKRFGNQNAGVAGHPFAHGAEDAGAAGAEQDDNRHIALNIRLMSRSLFLAFR